MAENAIYRSFVAEAVGRTTPSVTGKDVDSLNLIGMFLTQLIAFFALTIPAAHLLDIPVGLGISNSLILGLLIIIVGIISGLRIQS